MAQGKYQDCRSMYSTILTLPREGAKVKHLLFYFTTSTRLFEFSSYKMKSVAPSRTALAINFHFSGNCC